MELGTFKAPKAEAFDDGVEVDILHPVTSEPIGMKVTVCSYHSKRIKDLQRKMGNEALRAQRKNKQYTAEQLEIKQNEIIACAVIGWQGVMEDRVALECNFENVMKVISDEVCFFIREQIDAAAEDITLFMKA